MSEAVPILVASCDKYSDLWRPFFEILFRQWPDCPFPLYLGTNHSQFDDHRVATITVGDDPSWTWALRSMLQPLHADRVLLLLEDFFIQKPVDTSRMLQLLDIARQEDVDCLRLVPAAPPGKLPQAPRGDMDVIEEGTPFRLSAQAAFWRVKSLEEYLAPGFSAWEFEQNGTIRSNYTNHVFWAVRQPAIVYDHAVEKGKWKPAGIDICRSFGVAIDLSKRGVFSQAEIDAHLNTLTPEQAAGTAKRNAVDAFRHGERRRGIAFLRECLRHRALWPEAYVIAAAGLMGRKPVRLLDRLQLALKMRRGRRVEKRKLKRLMASAPSIKHGGAEMAPTVSVIMPAYNVDRFVAEAVDSVLGQTFADFELIVVNDGSHDRTKEILDSYTDPRVRVFHQPRNMGGTAALNRALSMARGRFVAPHDADDRSHPRRLEKQVAFLQTHDDAAVVGCRARVIDAHGRARRGISEYLPTTPLAIEWSLLLGTPFVHSGTMYRTAVVRDELNGYDPEYLITQDFELWTRLLAGRRGYTIADVLVDRRVYDSSLTGVRGEQFVASRRKTAEQNKQALRFSVVRILGDERFADEWVDIWSKANVSWVTGPPENWRRVLELLDEIRQRFTRLHPEARHDHEIRRHLAAFLVVTARHFMTFHRSAAAHAWARAAATDFRTAMAALPRLIAVAVGAPAIREFGRRLLLKRS